ncbi:MAG: class I SAM-dependent methyltransferase [Rhodothermales bacterium]
MAQSTETASATNAATSTATTHQFWETAFTKERKLTTFDESFAHKGSKTHRAFYEIIGDVKGKEILEVGCGAGKLSVFLATRGAHVTSTDFTQNALENTRALAAHNGVADKITLKQLDGLDLGSLNKQYDLVVGRFVLHHIEPFDQFVGVLHNVLKEDGRGVFFENNSRNPFLMFARENIAGKMGIPKYGDDEEYPLEQQEIEMIQKRFKRVTQHFPELVFFKKLDTYIFRHNRLFSPLLKLNKWLDASLFTLVPGSRKFSYLQIVEMVKGKS